MSRVIRRVGFFVMSYFLSPNKFSNWMMEWPRQQKVGWAIFSHVRRVSERKTGLSAHYSVCIDIGGTFTDCVVSSKRGLAIYKAASTPPNFERGFTDVLALAAAAEGLNLGAFLRATGTIVHGTTVSTNALIEGRTAQVGLICTAGHPDILTLREAPRKRAFDWKLDYPRPFVARNRTSEVRGRFDSRGNEIEALNEGDVRDAVAYFKSCPVDAVAVSLLWSVVAPAHERRVREIVSELWPELPVTLGHELNPIPREYRRTISAAIDASLTNIMQAYLGRVEGAVRDAGFTGSLLVANCIGGMMTVQEITRRPIYSVMSGPTLAPVAAQSLNEVPDMVVIDMGGTTFDVSAVRDGNLIVTTEAPINDDLLGLPKIDVRSVGAGGGSIAWVDAGGLLRVGPESAGADPGPACYSQGGKCPTVTDANLVLGILDADNFLGGRIVLDPAAAQTAIAPLAERLGLTLAEAAYAIHVTSNENMIAAIEDITINEGLDPRDSYVVAGGGAVGCHIGAMAQILGIGHFMVPRLAAGLSAHGGLVSDIRGEVSATCPTSDRSFVLASVNETLARLRVEAEEFLDRAAVASDARRFSYAFQARYKYQSWEIDVPFDRAPLQESDILMLSEAFHRMHERIYTIKNESDEVEFTTWTVRAVGLRDAVLSDHVPSSSTGPAERGNREVFVGAERAYCSVPVYDIEALAKNVAIDGPAALDSSTTTVLLHIGQRATIDVEGNCRIDCTPGQATEHV